MAGREAGCEAGNCSTCVLSAGRTWQKSTGQCIVCVRREINDQ